MRTEIKPEFHTELHNIDIDLARLKIELANVTLRHENLNQQKLQLVSLIRDKDRLLVSRLKEIAKEHGLDPDKSTWNFNIGDMSFTEVSVG